VDFTALNQSLNRTRFKLISRSSEIAPFARHEPLILVLCSYLAPFPRYHFSTVHMTACRELSRGFHLVSHHQCVLFQTFAWNVPVRSIQ